MSDIEKVVHKSDCVKCGKRTESARATYGPDDVAVRMGQDKVLEERCTKCGHLKSKWY